MMHESVLAASGGCSTFERTHHQYADARHRAAGEPRHRGVEIRRGSDHRLVGDADRRRPQRRRFHQPAAADVGPPGGRSARPTSTIRSATAASSTSGASSSQSWCSRSARECRFTKASSTSRIPKPAVSPLIAYAVLLIAFLLEGWSTLEAFQDFRKAKGDLSWFKAVRRSKDPPPSSSCSRMARRWLASSPRRLACCWRNSPAIRSTTAPHRS